MSADAGVTGSGGGGRAGAGGRGDGRTGRRCAVLGSPIRHSLSPVLHRAAYDALGLDWSYDAYDVTEASLGGFIAGLTPEYRGLSITMPLKAAVIPLCSRVSDTARLVGSVNTVLCEPDGSRAGDNTDVAGLVAALHEHDVGRIDSAVIVGTGSTAAAALAAVVRLGATRVVVLARSPAKAARVVEIGGRFDAGVTVAVAPLGRLAEAASGDVLVSTIPAAAQTAHAAALAALAPVVLDVTYHPASTPLLAAAGATGRVAVPGFSMLVHQAARQVELMTGCPEAPIDAMRTAGLAALEVRASQPGSP
jgi:shikimate dehydrogenase